MYEELSDGDIYILTYKEIIQKFYQILGQI